MYIDFFLVIAMSHMKPPCRARADAPQRALQNKMSVYQLSFSRPRLGSHTLSQAPGPAPTSGWFIYIYMLLTLTLLPEHLLPVNIAIIETARTLVLQNPVRALSLQNPLLTMQSKAYMWHLSPPPHQTTETVTCDTLSIPVPNPRNQYM